MPCSDCNPAFTTLKKLRECELLSRSRTNQAPVASSNECSELNELISRGEKDIVKLQERIAKLHELIVSLENDRKYILQQVHLAKSLMAPVRRLPAEMLRQIFIEHGVTNIISVGRCTIPALNIASVCSHWRSVALGTTALWNDFRLVLEEKLFHSRHVVLMKKLLERSASSLLTVMILTPLIPVEIPSHSVLLLLCEQSNRWQYLRGCWFSLNPTPDASLSSLQGRLESLHTCDFYCQDIRFLGGASKLRNFTLANQNMLSSSILWTQITQVEVPDASIPDIAQLLSKVPNLHTLGLRDLAIPHILSQPSEPPTRSNLEVLNFYFSMEVSVASMLDSLILPQLQSLSITGEEDYNMLDQDDRKWPSTQLPSLLSRSSARLTSFNLQGVWMSANDLIVLLHNMPTLHILSVSEIDHPELEPMLSDQIFRSIDRHQQAGQPMLPRLTSLTLESSVLAFSMQVFISAVQSRWKPSSSDADDVSCIRTVKLRIRDDFIDSSHSTMVHSIMMLRERGLNISIMDRNGEVALWEEE